MCVIHGVKGIDRRLSKTDILVGEVLSMVDETSTAASILDDLLAVRREAGWCVCTSRAFADVVWCRGGDDDFCALGDKGFGCVGEVGHVCLDDDTGGCGAGLVAGAKAICSPVVGGGEGAAVVVSELDDHVVAGDDFVNEGCEASFVGVGACGSAANGCVDDVGVLDGEGEVNTPACQVLERDGFMEVWEIELAYPAFRSHLRPLPWSSHQPCRLLELLASRFPRLEQLRREQPAELGW